MAFTEIALSDLELFETLNSESIESTYRGRWKSKGRIVAVKKVGWPEKGEVRYMLGSSNIYVLNLSQTRSWSCSLRPVQVEILSSLSHQNIVQFLGVAVMVSDSYLVAGAPHYAYYYCKRFSCVN